MTDLDVQGATAAREAQNQTGRTPLVVGIVFDYFAAVQQCFLDFNCSNITQDALFDGVPGEFVSSPTDLVADGIQRNHIA